MYLGEVRILIYKRRRLRSQILRQNAYVSKLFGFVVSAMGIIYLAYYMIHSFGVETFMQSEIYLKSLSSALVSFSSVSGAVPNEHIGFSLTNPYDVISSVIPATKANEEMSKKYAAMYNNSIKAKREKEEKGKIYEEEGKIIQEINMAKGLIFNNATEHAVDVNELLNASLPFQMDKEKPEVLIVHTHTSEAYADSPNGRSEDSRYNVVRVGEEIEKQLTAVGIKTIHDKTRNDYPSYNGSYKKALGVIQANLDKYPSIEIVLDIHRDYTVRADGTALKPTMTQDNKKAAQIMFVMGTNAMGLEHPNWKQNLSFAVKIQNELQKQYPDLCRPINIRIERFNQHVTKGSMIIEMGSSTNTLEEAVLAGEYTGKAIAKVLNGN